MIRRKLSSLPDQQGRRRLAERIRPFALRGIANRSIELHVGTHHIQLARATDAEGYFEEEVLIARQIAESHVDGDATIPLRLGLPGTGDDRAMGQATLLASKGFSVISDIDDTIKVTEMSDRSRLMENTFLREFRAVTGMAATYRKWREAGAGFHYVSLSPRPLFRPLSDFMNESGFPAGSLHLSGFRFRDQVYKRLFPDRTTYKTDEIRRLLEAFPERKFILIGDDADRDPEIYSELLAENSGQVTAVFIRVIGSASSRELSGRIAAAARDRTFTFRCAEDLPDQLKDIV